MNKQLHTIFSFILFTATALLPTGAAGGDFIAYANQLPPVRMIIDGRMQGIAGDIFYTIATNAGLDVSREDIRPTSVSEGLETVRSTPGTLLLGFVKNSQRAPHFKWVGPIYEGVMGIIARTGSNIRILKAADAKYYDIGSVRGSGSEKQAVRNGIPLTRLQRFAKSDEILDRLVSRELDMVVLPKLPAFYILLKKGLDTNDFEVIHELKRAKFYFAFNKQTDDAIIQRLQMELETLKRPGIDGESEYDRVVMKFFRPSL